MQTHMLTEQLTEQFSYVVPSPMIATCVQAAATARPASPGASVEQPARALTSGHWLYAIRRTPTKTSSP